MKLAYVFDNNTQIFLYGQPIEVNKDGSYTLPNNATWIPPKDINGKYMIKAKWNKETNEWKETGELPSPYVPEPRIEDYLRKQNAELTMLVAELQFQNQNLLKTQADLLLTLAEKGVI
jgi:hypothetical protein